LSVCVVPTVRRHQVIVRGPRPADNFAQIHNAALADGRLSFKARGILAYLLSRPPGWSTSAERLAKSGIDGERAVKSGLKELEEFGYLVRTRRHGPDGTFIHEQVITDQPATGAKQPDGESSEPFIDTTGAFCTGGKQPDINNTELITLISGEGGVVNPPNVGDSPAATSRTSYGIDREVMGEIKGVVLPTHLHYLVTDHKWLSPAALRTAHREIQYQDLALSITKYEIRAKELNRTPQSSEFLRWLIEDEQKILAEERKQAKENGHTRSWWETA
jgi:hypothetical protein